MPASEDAVTCPGRTVCELDVRHPFFYLVENTSLINHLVSTWSGMVTASAGNLKLQLPSYASLASVAIEIHREEPVDVVEQFQDVIEFSYPSVTGRPAVLDWSRTLVCELNPLPVGAGDYRVRYHVQASAEVGNHFDLRSPGSAKALVQIWPASLEQLKELKITGALGEFWHPGERLRRAWGF
ncbi:hypothetical protein SAMN04489729_7031 [Amycolatopsis lurida]|uniref:hypothetical protein n=1 Tax=Amycolatopsis lurida TaxID=31959 RepID=UPI0008985045|nr:hypothetical protein [Amycolatopsis lurida]SEE30689.1 hypothetical protein SAMN04489729_7031 [Amycolatopsis lurida]